MSTVSGKVVKIKFDADKEKKNGDTFKAHLIKLDSQENTIVVGANSPAGKYAKDKLQLKEGDEITVETGGQYNTVVKIQKKNFTSGKRSFSGGSSKTYDATGAIQGMVLNNAIQLALQKNRSEDVTAEDIVHCAKIVLAARVETDKLVVASMPKAAAKDDFEDDAPTKPKSDDFSTSDDEF